MLLKDRGVRLQDHFVKSFDVPYSTYEKMTKVYCAGTELMEKSRVLLDVFKITCGGKRIASITAAWDTEESPNRIPPKSSSDAHAIREFSKHRDSFFVFRMEGEEYDIKLRAFALPIVMEESPEVRCHEIIEGDIRLFSGKKVDSRGRKNRNVVFDVHAGYLEEVIDQTNDAIEKFLGRPDISGEINQLYQVK
ncbi:hypothetical protein [Rhodovulum sp. MB263]|uniref:hypothetical protein n=1 Tax=Rhodovulum sp. (strain MB263) TaxID=308754 RepID=UPI0012DB311E|nr:hypothetical protein [Rhodovulum sp. MB263]